MATSSLSASTSASESTSTVPEAFSAVTTPFVQRSECGSIWEVTSDTLPPWREISGTVTILASDAADERFASCQPSGWDNGGESSILHFSPAVCPSGWKYFNMQQGRDYKTLLSENLVIASTSSYAYCCSSGMSLDHDFTSLVPTITRPCYRFFSDGETTMRYTVSGRITREFTGGALLHNAWRVAWAASDTSTLSPQLPTLTPAMVVPTWTPGEIIPSGKYDPPDHDHDHDEGSSHTNMDGLLYFVMVGIPIIGVTVIALCTSLCIRKHKKNKRERKRLEDLVRTAVSRAENVNKDEK